MKEEIQISVLVLSYNHAQYIKQALDGILMQNIDVPYEIIVHDDVSTDGTQEILREYKKRYPDRIRLYLRKKKARSVTYASCQMLQLTLGKYVAFCEGDDYWTDADKLKKQYEFLETHSDYVGVSHEKMDVNQDGKKIYDQANKDYYKWRGRYTLKNYWYSGRLVGQTATLMFRNLYVTEDISLIYKAHDMMGDVSNILIMLTHGDIYRMDDVMSARRIVRKKGAENWNSILLQRDGVMEHVGLDLCQLKWYEKKTGDYKMTLEKWKELFSVMRRHVLKSSSFEELKNRLSVLLDIIAHLMFCYKNVNEIYRVNGLKMIGR